MTGTMGHVSQLISHPISFKSERYGLTFEGCLVFSFLLERKSLRSKHNMCQTHLLCTHLLMFKISNVIMQICNSQPELRYETNNAHIITTYSVSNMKNMSSKYPRSVPKLSEKCPKHVRYASETCPKHVPNMSETCPNSVRNVSEQCLKTVRQVSDKCRTSVRTVSETCPNRV
jgi:hypothetical protein